MCYPRAPSTPCQDMEISKTKWSQGIFSPTQMWKALRQLTLNKTRHIRSVTGTASQRVRRVRRWVFNFTFSKIVIPILVLGFMMLVLSPYKDIQVGHIKKESTKKKLKTKISTICEHLSLLQRRAVLGCTFRRFQRY